MIGSKLATNLLPLTSHGGRFAKGQPRVIVMHSIECPIQRGRALSIARYLNTVGLSVHYLVDPGAVVQGLDETLIGWGAGTVNTAAIHIEQAGYARYSRKQWTTNDGLAEIRRAGELVADITKRNNIPLRWLTDGQLYAAYRGQGPGGVTTHAQCTRVIGGTTHKDPGTGYPKDLLLKYAQGQNQGDDMAGLTDKLTLTDYRGRFTDGNSPDVTMTVEEFIGNTWEFVKYSAGRLDQLADQVDALTAAVGKVQGGGAAGTYTGTLTVKKK